MISAKQHQTHRKSDGKIIIYADASLWRDALCIYEINDLALAIVEA